MKKNKGILFKIVEDGRDCAPCSFAQEGSGDKGHQEQASLENTIHVYGQCIVPLSEIASGRYEAVVLHPVYDLRKEGLSADH